VALEAPAVEGRRAGRLEERRWRCRRTSAPALSRGAIQASKAMAPLLRGSV